jgi:hypothetical protein
MEKSLRFSGGEGKLLKMFPWIVGGKQIGNTKSIQLKKFI